MHLPRDSDGLLVFTGGVRLLRRNCPEASGNLPRSAGIATNWTRGEIQAIFFARTMRVRLTSFFAFLLRFFT
jgi:hypothetical protein